MPLILIQKGKAMTSDKENLNLMLQQLQQGSEQAFTVLYDKFSKPLYRTILRLVKDEDIAQELLQDLFMKIWEKKEKINLEGSFKSFLYKVAENIVYSYFRKVAKDARLIDKLISDYVDFDTNAEELIIAKETNAMLQRAIECLPTQRQQVYILCKLQGKTHEEVSNLLGISTSTINNQIVKANKSVKEYFNLNREFVIFLLASELIKYLT
ncbi:RNA polymerase sigma-70 factor (ECF subfamily) [Mucilaginibacter lappiensis]|uniref:RNA polymerase sigma-70 factor (ECF subfamily) n=1 Tax=Mucilaginibacter lappiensis TaxID=354630 RepID=A0ABR6PDC8_9SPHI|nr:sigma-70 family RNA polymerase sigma factor [Mucilaginibacter lappiensis]MBB6107765.1 RNA polymerase sigma-70 factor (ECF subfamily) [Mucilaginibacter lappiensis]